MAGVPLHWADADVRGHFAPYGPISSSKLLLDSSTGRSRGIAFVSYPHLDHAQAAIAALDGRQPEGEARALQVKFAAVKTHSPKRSKGGGDGRHLSVPSSPTSISSHSSLSSSLSSSSSSSSLSVLPPPSSPPSSSSSFTPPSSEPSLYIAGLPTASTRESLLTLLSPFGALASLRILPLTPERVGGGGGGGSNRGVAFARYVRVEDAERAMEALNGMGRGEGGKGLTVRWATHNRGKESGTLTPSLRMAGPSGMEPMRAEGGWGYAGSMSPAASYDYQAMMMGGVGAYGATQGAYASMDLMAASTYAAYGLQVPYVMDPAYLYYYAQVAAAAASPASAAGVGPAASAAPSTSQLPSPSSGSASNPSSSLSLPPPAALTLFLCHLAPQLTDGGLFALFSPFGCLTQCRVVRERDGRSKGYGFVSYQTTDECRAALMAMHGVVVEGRAMKVQWKGEKAQQMGAGVADAYHQMAGWWGTGVSAGQPVMA